MPKYLVSELFQADVVTKPGCTLPRMIATLSELHECRSDSGMNIHVVVLHVGTNDLYRSFFDNDLKNFK